MSGERIHPADARAQGFIIDDSCYPWFAYKGERRAPDVWLHCYTDLESALIGQKGDATLSVYVDDRLTVARTSRSLPFATEKEFLIFACALLGVQKIDVFIVTKFGRAEMRI